MFRMARLLEANRSLDGANTASTRWYSLPGPDARSAPDPMSGASSKLSAEFIADLRSSPRDTAGAAVRVAGRVLF